MISSSVQSKACAKFILSGEHSVVYGASAIAAPLLNSGLEMQVGFQDSDSPLMIDVWHDTRGVDSASHNIVTLAFHDACEVLHIKNKKVDVHISSNIPLGAGLGSSASLCVSFVKACLLHLNKNMSSNEQHLIAHVMERRFHGNPSGVDTAVISHENLIKFIKNKSQEFFTPQVSLPWNLVLIDSYMRSSTKDMVELVSPRFFGIEGQKRLQSFSQCTENIYGALLQDDFLSFTEEIHRNGEYLNEIGCANEKILNMMEEAKKMGCLATKITGAGGGGMILAVLPQEKNKRDEVISRLEKTFTKKAMYETAIN